MVTIPINERREWRELGLRPPQPLVVLHQIRKLKVLEEYHTCQQQEEEEEEEAGEVQQEQPNDESTLTHDEDPIDRRNDESSTTYESSSSSASTSYDESSDSEEYCEWLDRYHKALSLEHTMRHK